MMIAYTRIACTHVAIVLSTILLYTVPVPVFAADPILHLSYASDQSNAPVAQRPVIFDASLSYDTDTPGSSLRYSYDFGDGTVLYGVVNNTISHVYKQSGRFTARVTLTDNPGSAPSFATTNAGSAAPFQVVTLWVGESGGCYSYAVNKEGESARSHIVVEPGDLTKLQARLVSNHDRGDLSGSGVSGTGLTELYAQIGETPTLQTSNSSIAVHLDFVPYLFPESQAWEALISADNETSAVSASIGPEFGSSIQGCTTATTTIGLSVRSIRGKLGLAMSQQATAVGEKIISTGFQPSSMVIRENVCSPSAAFLLLYGSSSQSAGGLGALALLTEDSFGPETQVIDLNGALDPLIIAGTNETVCVVPNANCADLKILDVAYLRRQIVVLTSHGVVVSSDLQRRTAVTWQRVITGRGELDNPTPLLTSSRARMYRPTHCSVSVQAPLPEPIYIVYSPSSGASDSVVASLDGARQNWTAITLSFAPLSAALPSPFRIVGMVYAQFSQEHIALVCDSTSRSCQTVTFNTTSVALGHRFPLNVRLTGMEFHASGVEVLVFGREVWMSSDGGQFFTRLAELPSHARSLVSTVDRDGWAALLDDNQVYYGRSTVVGAVAVSSPLLSPTAAAAHPLKFMDEIKFDRRYNLVALQLSIPSSYPSNPLAYPVGLMATPSGLARNGSDSSSAPLVKSTILPLNTAVYNQLRLPSQLALTSRTGVLTLVGTSFTLDSVGAYVTFIQGGAALITGLTSNGAVGRPTSPISTCSRFECPAVQRQVTVGGDWSVEGASATLSLPTGVDRRMAWLISDQGRTFIAGAGAILLTTFHSPESMSGTVVSPLTHAGPFESGSWELIDTRTYKEDATINIQTLTIAGGPTMYTATLSTGFMGFATRDLHKVLEFTQPASPALGSIIEILSPSQVRFTRIGSQAVPTGVLNPGSWSMWAPGSGYGSSPPSAPVPDTLKCATYVLEVAPCPYTDFREFSLDRSGVNVFRGRSNMHTEYIDQTEGFEVLSSITPSSAELDYIMIQPNVVDFDSTLDLSVVELGRTYRQVNITLKERGERGYSIVSIHPPGSTLKCDSSSQKLHVLMACPPTLRVEEVPRISVTGMVERRLTGLNDSFVLLPVNYRPPSVRGRGIPLTDNIYNGDPSRKRHFDRFPISKSTGTYKRCQEGGDRDSCGCTPYDLVSQRVEDSDCIDTVLNAFYIEEFVPVMRFIQDGKEKPINPQFLYRLEELNNRTDYCFNNTVQDGEGIKCNDVNAIKSALLDPRQYDAIKWLGVELYHFRLHVVGPTHCELSTEFTVWVRDAPVDTPLFYSLIGITAVIIALLLLLAYWCNFRKYDRLAQRDSDN